MKPNELRIGNWIEIIQPKKGVYTTIQPSSFTVDIELHFNPILLTEEWLLNFGFKKESDWWLVFLFGFYSVSICNDKSGFNFSYNDGHIPILYVHQLQNLIFALTDEELVINKL